MYICCRFKRKTENGSPGDFNNTFTLISSCKQKLSVYKRTKWTNGLVDLCNHLSCRSRLGSKITTVYDKLLVLGGRGAGGAVTVTVLPCMLSYDL